MATVDRIVIEIDGDDSGFQSAIGRTKRHVAGLEDIFARIDTQKRSLSDMRARLDDLDAAAAASQARMASVASVAGVAIASAVGTYKAINVELDYIVANAERLSSQGIITDEEIERAEGYRRTLSEIASAIGTGAKDIAARGTMTSLNAAESVSGSIGLTALGAAIGGEFNPASTRAIRPEQITFARNSAYSPGGFNPYAGQEEAVAQRQADVRASVSIGGGLSSLVESVRDGVAKGFTAVVSGGSSAGDWFVSGVREWKHREVGRERELKDDEERRMRRNVGTAGISLGNTAAGYAELHKQMNQQQVLVDETRTQTNILSDILEAAKTVYDPFSNG